MNNYKFSIVALLPLFLPVAYANTFEPSNHPLIIETRAKPNIHLVLDHSWIVNNSIQDTWIPEHAYGFGDPECMPQENSWRKDRKNRGEYDPFSQGRYLPWDSRKTDINGLINGLKKPPRIEKCIVSKRSDGVAAVFQDIFDLYKFQAYLGASYFSFVNPIKKRGQTSLALPIDDYSNVSTVYDIRFQNIRKEVRDGAHVASTFYPGVYEAIKYMRGQGMSKQSVDFEAASWYAPMKKECTKGQCYYDMWWHKSPIRYRCQKNHMVTLTGGVPEKYRNFGIAQEDNLPMVLHPGNGFNNNIPPYMFYAMAYSDSLPSKDLGRISKETDLRDNQLRRYQRDVPTDKAGKDWHDKNSIAMPIQMHTVLFNNEHHADGSDMKERLSNITAPTNGMKIRYENRYDNSEMLKAAFDVLVAPTVRSKNGFAAVDDRKIADISKDVGPNYYDLSKTGAIRYQTSYNFNAREGFIKGVVPYLIDEVPKINDSNAKAPRIRVYTILDSSSVNTKRFLTLLNTNENGLKFDELKSSQVKNKFEEIYKNTHWSGDLFLDTYINWLSTDHVSDAQYPNDYPEHLRKRTTSYGSITSSDIVLANKDELNININKDKMSENLSAELIEFLKFKAHAQPTNLLIVSDNNGFISFINAVRGLTGKEKSGERNTAYFPQILVHRFNEIAKLNRPATLIFDGKTNLVDAKVYSPSLGNLYATIGMTSMGAGGKGIVGYRVYAAKKSSVDNWVKNPKNNPPSISNTDPINKVIPLFEITNEGPEIYRTKGFEDLGYTYSGFEFFNQVNNGVGQSIAVFGNGFGTEKSVLYFIDAYTGKKLHEIILNKFGGGAATPSIIVRNSPNNGGQVLDRIYVGDYSGNLYRIQFNGDHFTDGSIKVTSLFKIPTQFNNSVEMQGQSAISIKPLVVKHKVSDNDEAEEKEFYSIAFGSGIAGSQELNRGENSLVDHSLYNIVDHDRTSSNSSATVDELKNRTSSLSPLIEESNLESGSINYQSSKPSDYSNKQTYQLNIIHELNISKTNDDLYNSDGWYRKLTADDTRSGERIIHSPKYDSANNAIVFSTWGIREQSTQFDPCIPNEPYNKLISLDVNHGENIEKQSELRNTGITSDMYGGIVGSELSDSPEGNSHTILDRLELDRNITQGLIEDIVSAVGEADTSFTPSSNYIGRICANDLSGNDVAGTPCEWVDRRVILEKGRVNFQKRNAYF